MLGRTVPNNYQIIVGVDNCYGRAMGSTLGVDNSFRRAMGSTLGVDNTFLAIAILPGWSRSYLSIWGPWGRRGMDRHTKTGGEGDKERERKDEMEREKLMESRGGMGHCCAL